MLGGLFQALFKPLAESNKNQRVYFQSLKKKKKKHCVFKKLLSLGWIPLGGEYWFLYLLGGVNLYPIEW